MDAARPERHNQLLVRGRHGYIQYTWLWLYTFYYGYVYIQYLWLYTFYHGYGFIQYLLCRVYLILVEAPIDAWVITNKAVINTMT